MMKWLFFRLAYFSGKEAAGKKKWEQAYTHLQRALKIKPSSPEAAIALAEAEWNCGKKEEACQRLEPLLQSQPDSAETLVLLGQFRVETGNLSQAKDHLQKAANLSPSPEIWHSLGKCYVKSQNMPEAFQAFRVAVKMNPWLAQETLNAVESAI